MTKLFPIALLLAGCDQAAQMNAANNATRVQVAALQSQADTTAAWIQGQTTLGVAQSQAMSEVATNAAWASQLPWVVMAVCVTVVIVTYIWYRSRMVVYQPQAQPPMILPPMPSARVLPTPAQRQAALDFAQQYGGQVVWTPDGTPLLQVNGQLRQLRITAK